MSPDVIGGKVHLKNYGKAISKQKVNRKRVFMFKLRSCEFSISGHGEKKRGTNAAAKVVLKIERTRVML